MIIISMWYSNIFIFTCIYSIITLLRVSLSPYCYINFLRTKVLYQFYGLFLRSITCVLHGFISATHLCPYFRDSLICICAMNLCTLVQRSHSYSHLALLFLYVLDILIHTCAILPCRTLLLTLIPLVKKIDTLKVF